MRQGQAYGQAYGERFRGKAEQADIMVGTHHIGTEIG